MKPPSGSAFNIEQMMSRAVGFLLILVGMGFIAVLVFALATQEVRGQFGDLVAAVVFMAGFGALLLWVGWTFLRPGERVGEAGGIGSRAGSFLIRYKFAVELLAVAGCGLMLVRTVAFVIGADWPSGLLLFISVRAPIATGLLMLGILPPGAFRSGLFRVEVWDRWPSAVRSLARAVVGVGWLGYFVVFFLAFGLEDGLPPALRPLVRVLTSAVLFFVYASQVLALHFGRIRKAGSDNA